MVILRVLSYCFGVFGGREGGGGGVVLGKGWWRG